MLSAAQPFLASDVMAFVLAVIAVLYLALWRRDSEPGMGWCALSMALLAVWAATNRLHLPTSPYLVASPWFYLMCFAMAALARGLVDYLGVRGRARRIGLWATVGPAAAYLALIGVVTATEARVPRLGANLLIAAGFTAMGVLAWRAARTEPGAGHRWVALALWFVPAFSIGLVVARVDAVALRYWGVPPVIVVALTLLSAAVLRRRRALEAEVARRAAAEAALTRLNASLERAVEERTRDLHEIVAGLQSFNRSVSHDLRGSLGGIAGLARMADEALARGDASLARRALPVIARQADHSTETMAALLSLARVGDAPLHATWVELQRLAEQVVTQLLEAQPAAEGAPHIEVQAMPAVQADAELLKPVLANLIGNAIKFTRGRPAARVEIGAERQGDDVVVHVRDNGVGFDAEAAGEMLFNPFVRLHGQAFAGHGVGLSIVRRAVERHGGRVWAESRPGEGSVFRFSLPGGRSRGEAAAA